MESRKISSFLLVYLFGAAVVAVIANKRGRDSGAWFVLSLIISPLIAGLIVVVQKQAATIICGDRGNRSD
jgi:hypothetical protein